MKKCFFLLLTAFSFSSFVVGQDTLRALDGRILEVKIKRITEDQISFEQLRKSRLKTLTLEKQEVFSYTLKGKSEVLIYKYQPEIGNIYELQEMKDYMVGERHADQEYRPLISNILAFGSGIWAGSAIANENHIAVAIPLVSASLLMVPGIKIKDNAKNGNYKQQGAYRDGYKRVARGKKFLDAMKFSGLGMLGSFLVFEAFD